MPLLRQSIYSRLAGAGYEDVNDGERLRVNPVLKTLREDLAKIGARHPAHQVPHVTNGRSGSAIAGIYRDPRPDRTVGDPAPRVAATRS